MSESNSIYIVYQTTNLVNQNIYIGVHKQKSGYDPHTFDGYLGSGKWLIRAVNKYGNKKFVRETLFVFDNEEDAYQKEAEIVNEEFVVRDDTYNMRGGGYGSCYVSEESREKIRIKMKANWEDADFRNNLITKMKRRFKNPTERLKLKKQTINYWKSKTAREIQSHLKKQQHRNRPDIIRKISKSVKNLWLDDAYREQQTRKITIAWNCPIRKNARSKEVTLMWQDEEYRKKQKIGRKRIQCEFCRKWIEPAAYARYHGVNCDKHPNWGTINKEKRKGKVNPEHYKNRGKRKSSTRKKISDTLKNAPRCCCMICGKEISMPGFAIHYNSKKCISNPLKS